MITIIDYDAGNIKSVEKAFEYIGERVHVTSAAEDILNADKLVLPGVGSFGEAVEKLKERKLINVIKEAAKNGIPFLGICLGMQLIFKSSEESPEAEGLDLLSGKIIRFSQKPSYKIPHMGWNSLSINKNSRLLAGIGEEPYVYFVHSYYLQADNEEQVSATTEYITKFHAAVEYKNIYGCQFHPEKSGDVGIKILRNFSEI